jgi:hypothetical protein
MAASYYGVPRTTSDVDFIVQVPIDDLDKFLDKLAYGRLLVDKGMIKTQLAAGYNIVSLQHERFPYQVDLIIQTEGRLERRPGTALGMSSYYQPPEQLILSKLRMIKATRPAERSFKDREDIKQILTNTRVNKRKILQLARRQSTIQLARQVLDETSTLVESSKRRKTSLMMKERLRKKPPKRKSRFGAAGGIGPFTADDEMKGRD